MNNEIFVFNEHLIRTAGDSDNPLFIAKDVCALLEVQDQRQALENIPAGEKFICEMPTEGGPQGMVALSEPGLYRLIFKSVKPNATLFQNWVFKEVLPAIRRTGRYGPHGFDLALAFAQAKTGGAQIEILRLMREGNPPASKTAGVGVCLDVEGLWRCLLAGRAAGRLANAFRVINGTLYIYPEAVMVYLRLQPEHAKLTRPELRLALASLPEWVEPPASARKHVQRFGGLIYVCWAFTPPESGTMKDLADAVLSAGPGENVEPA